MCVIHCRMNSRKIQTAPPSGEFWHFIPMCHGNESLIKRKTNSHANFQTRLKDFKEKCGNELIMLHFNLKILGCRKSKIYIRINAI